uniref:Uncharacterized protein n=1 Tax=Octopus bimaculoides TaxID=37653 RepID=A0A0L8GXU9_OCTBM
MEMWAAEVNGCWEPAFTNIKSMKLKQFTLVSREDVLVEMIVVKPELSVGMTGGLGIIKL